MDLYAMSGGSDLISWANGWSWSPTVNTLYHCAIVKNGTSYLFFVNGTQQGSIYTHTGVLPNWSATVNIGYYKNSGGTVYTMNGYIDEFRLTKGVAKWTSDFTPPSAPY